MPLNKSDTYHYILRYTNLTLSKLKAKININKHAF